MEIRNKMKLELKLNNEEFRELQTLFKDLEKKKENLKQYIVCRDLNYWHYLTGCNQVEQANAKIRDYIQKHKLQNNDGELWKEW